MEPKDSGAPPRELTPEPPASPKETARAVLKGFLQDRGVAVDDSLDAIAGGLQALLGGDSSDDDDDDCGGGEEDEEGEGGKKKQPPAFVTETYRRKRPPQQSGGGDGGPVELELSLASSHHSLWGHRLWNAAMVLGEMVDAGELDVRGKNCLELGAGAALPSLLAALNGARRAVASDYASSGDAVLVAAIQQSIDRLVAHGHAPPGVLSAVGYIWGQPVAPLLAPLGGGGGEGQGGFDLIFCADLIFNRSEHAKLLRTCKECLLLGGPAEGGRGGAGAVIVTYSHHDPAKAPLDLRFFELAREAPFGFVVEDVKVEQRVDLFVEGDGLDEARGKVYVKRLTLPSLAAPAAAAAKG